MKVQVNFLVASTAHLAALIEDQERLLEVIRRKEAELVGIDCSTRPHVERTETRPKPIYPF